MRGGTGQGVMRQTCLQSKWLYSNQISQLMSFSCYIIASYMKFITCSPYIPLGLKRPTARFFLQLEGLARLSLDTSDDGLLKRNGDWGVCLKPLWGLAMFSLFSFRGDLLGLASNKGFMGDFTGLLMLRRFTADRGGLLHSSIGGRAVRSGVWGTVAGNGTGDVWGLCVFVVGESVVSTDVPSEPTLRALCCVFCSTSFNGDNTEALWHWEDGLTREGSCPG